MFENILRHGRNANFTRGWRFTIRAAWFMILVSASDFMHALRFTNGSLSLTDIPRPNIDGEALIRVTKSGICNTDLEIVRGYAGFEGTIGHEFVGVVENAPDAPHLIGKRVVGEINAGCGTCDLCTAGDPRHCPARTVLGIIGRDGAHAEYLQLPSRNLLVVPDTVRDEEAVHVAVVRRRAAGRVHVQRARRLERRRPLARLRRAR